LGEDGGLTALGMRWGRGRRISRFFLLAEGLGGGGGVYKAAEDLVSLVEIVLLAAVGDTDFIDDIAEEAQGVAESVSLKGIAHQFVLCLGVSLAS